MLDRKEILNKVVHDCFKEMYAKAQPSADWDQIIKEYDESAEISLIQKMVQERLDSANIYKENGRHDLADGELAQADVLSELLPPIPTEDDIIEYLNEYYPSGIEKKSMGLVIKEVKAALLGIDGQMVANCVKSRLVWIKIQKYTYKL